MILVLFKDLLLADGRVAAGRAYFELIFVKGQNVVVLVALIFLQKCLAFILPGLRCRGLLKWDRTDYYIFWVFAHSFISIGSVPLHFPSKLSEVFVALQHLKFLKVFLEPKFKFFFGVLGSKVAAGGGYLGQ